MKFNMEIFAQWAQILSNIAVGASAITVAVIGIKGLEQWRAQMKGTTEYQVAQRILRAVLTVRDAIRNSRAHYTGRQEWAGRKPDEHESREEASVLDQAFAYHQRLIEVQKAASDLQQAALEAEVLWGESVSETLEPLNKSVRELFATYEMHFSLALDQARGKRSDAEFLRDSRRTLYGHGENDDYSRALEAAVKQCGDAFRVHLK